MGRYSIPPWCLLYLIYLFCVRGVFLYEVFAPPLVWILSFVFCYLVFSFFLFCFCKAVNMFSPLAPPMLYNVVWVCFMCMYVCLRVSTYVYICLRVSTCVYVCLRVSTCVYVSTCLRVYVCVCVCVSVCVCDCVSVCLCVAQHSTLHHSTHSTAQYSTVQYSTTQYCAPQHIPTVTALHHCTAQHSASNWAVHVAACSIVHTYL